MKRNLLVLLLACWAMTGAWAQPVIDANRLEGDPSRLFIGSPIESHQFEANKSMEGVKVVLIGSKVSLVPEWAFAVNPSLEKVVLHDGLKEIGDHAFFSCKNLKRINLGAVGVVGDGAFTLTGIREADLSKARVIKSYAFSECEQLVSVKFGGNLSSIGEFAFDGDTLLRKCHVYSGHIGDNAFMGCSSLKSVLLKKGSLEVKTIGKAAFLGCTHLSKVVLPEHLTTIEPMTFAFCSGLTSVRIPNDVTKIGEKAFQGSGLKKIVIPASVNIVEAEAFSQCANLEKVIVKGRQTVIEDHAFDNHVEIIRVSK